MGLILPTGFKLDLPNVDTYETLRNISILAEELGYENLWSFDHLTSYPKPYYPILEPWSVLSALARDTNKIRLGTLVTCTAFRHPALLAKIATTIDLISKGRVELGIGSGWYKVEFDQYGFQNYLERVNLFQENIQILTDLLAGEEVNFIGKYFKLTNARISPLPLQKPSIPIWVGATGPRMLRLTAKYASRWNMRGTPDYFVANRERLSKYLEEYGRKPSEITESIYLIVSFNEDRQEAKRLIQNVHTSTPLGQRLEMALKEPKTAANFLKARIKKTIDHDQRNPTGSDVIGNDEDCIEQLSKYIDLGVSHFFLYLVGLDAPSKLEDFTDHVLNKV